MNVVCITPYKPNFLMRIFQLSFLLSSVFTPLSSLDAKESRPNIVFLLADDMRHDSFGFMKKFEVQTPTLDRQ